jgi:hypothetical protein
MSGTMPPPPRTALPPSVWKVGRSTVSAADAVRCAVGLVLGLLELILFVLRDALDGAATRGIPAPGRELECGVVGEGIKRLDQTLTKGRHTHYHRAIVVLQRARK